ncbi:MAG TPA: hypothetical protein VJT31_26705, partial [Rugosimonospora sp.]|nr:hypothetical protein [Rugosimonospora sp.]
MSHHDAGTALVLGAAVGALFLVVSRLAGRPDRGGARAGAVAFGIVGMLGLGWAAIGFANLFLPQPVVSNGVFQCRVGADRHVMINVRNAGQTVLLVGSVTIQLKDAQGQSAGDPVMMFLPSVLK